MTHSWKKAQATFHITPSNALSIQLQYSTPFIGSMAIDDIKLSMGECRYDSEIECDFSNGYCGYQVRFVC